MLAVAKVAATAASAAASDLETASSAVATEAATGEGKAPGRMVGLVSDWVFFHNRDNVFPWKAGPSRRA